MLTDGPRIYVQESVGGRFVAVQVSSGGGESVPIPTDLPNLAIDNISQDKSELLVGAFSGVEQEQVMWGLPILGGTARRLSDFPGVDGGWMPNGDLLVSHDNKLWEIPKQGGAARLFADPAAFSWWFRWSPDGKILRFTEQDPKTDTQDLWEISADGKNLHRLLPGWKESAYKTNGNWTADGNYFLFVVVSNNRGDIWALPEKGDWLHKVDKHPIQLTAGPLGFASPQPSPDGKKIYAIGVQFHGEMTRYDRKSGQFAPYLGGISSSEVSFSADKQWVAYVTFPEHELWRSRTDGTEKLQLYSSNQSFWVFPRWSPDGTQVSFVLEKPGKADQLCVVDRDGGSVRVLYAAKGIIRPAWLDGTTMIFASAPTVPEEGELDLLNVNTGQLSRLPDSKGLVLPAISPDGHYVASSTSDGRKLKVFDFKTKAWQEFLPTSVGFTEWSTDSRNLYFDSGLGKDPAIYRLQLAQRKIERIVSLKDFRRVTIGATPWMGLTPDGSPLLVRDTGTQEVYALDFDEP